MNVFSSKKLILLIILSFAFLFMTGCEINIGTSNSGKGVLVSEDFGETWQQKTKGFLGIKKKEKIKDILSKEKINVLILDPQNSKTIYIGTERQGLFVSEDQGEVWKNILNKVKKISDIAIDPKVSDIIYCASGRTILKTTNRGETWASIYIEPQANAQITSLAIDFNEPNNIYMATSLGILKSKNYGNTWEVLKWVNKGVKKIYFHTFDSKKIFAVSYEEGIFKTSDAGKTWEQINESLKNFKGGTTIYDLWPGREKEIFLATKYGFLKSDNDGQKFEEIKTLIKPSTSEISQIGINPKNSQEIYFTSKNTFYKSIDNGKNWTMRSLPSSSSVNLLVIDPNEPRRIYLGMK